jgi:tetratricopeptide (TPR) repeat protein
LFLLLKMPTSGNGSGSGGVNWTRVGIIAGGAAIAASVGFAAYYQMKKSSNRVPPDPSDPQARQKLKALAEEFKTKGNAFFAKKDYAAAAKAFRSAVDYIAQIDPLDKNLKDLLAICHNNLSASYEQIGDTEQTLLHCERAISFNPKYGKALIRRGRSLLRNKQYEEALRDYVEAVYCTNNEAQAKALQQDLEKVCNAIAEKRVTKLLEERKGLPMGIAQHDVSSWLWASSIHDPVLNDLNAQKGRSLADAGTLEDALQSVVNGKYDEVYAKARAIVDNVETDQLTRAKAILLSARFLYYHDKAESAREQIKEFESAFNAIDEETRKEQNDLFVSFLALSATIAETTEDAKRYAEKAETIDAANTDAQMAYALKIVETSEDAHSVEAFKKILQVEPNHPYAKYYESYCSFVVAAQANDVGQMHNSIIALEQQAKKDEPEVPVFAYVFLTKIAMTMQNIELAVESVGKAMKRQPDCSLVKYLKCLLDLDKCAMNDPSQLMNYMDEMKDVMTELQETDPNYWEPLRMLAKYYVDKKDYDRALHYYNRALNVMRKKDEIALVMGEMIMAEQMKARENADASS